MAAPIFWLGVLFFFVSYLHAINFFSCFFFQRVQHTPGKRQITGYILFSIEIRKSITQRNPEANFGEISRLVGIEWKKLTDAERRTFEDRAHQLNLENSEKAQQALADSPNVSTTPTQISKVNPFVFISFIF